MKKILTALLALAAACTMSLSAMAVEEPAEAPEIDEVMAMSDEANWIDSADTAWYTGDATEYTIDTADELAGLAKLVNEGTAFSSGSFNKITVKLTADINLDGKEWTPIGGGINNKTFAGIFDGGNNTISNLVVTINADGVGLFGRCAENADFGVSAEIKNLTINNAEVSASGRDGVAAVAGYGHTELKVDNVKVTGKLDIFGYRGVAAVVGKGYADVYNCTVDAEGTIASQFWCAGGIIGHSDEPCVTIENCKVIGVDIDGGSYNGAGGIAGYIAENSTISDVVVEDVTIEGDNYYYGGYVAGNGYTNATNATVENVTSLAGGEVIVPEDAENVTILRAKIGDTKYASLKDAIYNAKEGETIVLLGNISEGSIKLPATITNLTIDGQETAIVKDTVITASDGGSVVYKGLTIKNTTFENSRFVLGGQRTGDVIYEDLTFDNNKFLNIVDVNSMAAIHMNVGFEENEYVKNFKFTNNVIDGVSGSSNSGILFKSAIGNVIIENNTIKNVAFNAVQLQYVVADTKISIKNNKFYSGSHALNFNQCQSGNIAINDNVIVVPSGSKWYISHLGADAKADVSENFWGYIENGEVVLDTAYTSKVSGGTTKLTQYAPYYTDEEKTELSVPAAVIGTKNYNTLDEAIADAKDGDVVIIAPGEYDIALNITKSIVLTGDPNYGTTGAALAATTEKPVINISTVTDGGVQYHAPNVVFDNLVFNVLEDATGAGWNVSAIGYYYEIVKDRDGLTITNCDFINNSDISMSAIAANIAKYTVKNNTFKNFTTMVHSFVDHGALGEVVVSDNTFENVENIVSVYWGAENAAATLTVKDNKSTDGSNAKIIVDDFGKTKATPVMAIPTATISGNDAEITLLNYDNTNNYTVENNAAAPEYSYASEEIMRKMDGKLPDGVVYVAYGTADQQMFIVVDGYVKTEAESVELVFVPNTTYDAKALENSVWDLVLIASDAEIINRLNSADFTFELTTDEEKDAMAYEIIATNDEVAINNVNNSADRYEFHYENKDASVDTDTALRIALGTVKFTGFGAFTFKVDTTDVAENTNQAHATTFVDNIVDSYTVNAGTLTVNNTAEDADGDTDFGTIDSEIIVPTKALTINIDFPNAVADNKIAYQQMKVVVSGGELEAPLTIDLGTDYVVSDLTVYDNKENVTVTVTENNPYAIVITNLLEENTAYTVEVSGEGYRTAKYTVTMTKDKTLNFWNNVKDNAIEVEEGKDSSAKNVTFLAGDIVKDGTINIYDLSAVVSYFGEIDLVEDGMTKYAKYDLNRDGKIDSKDVAYVLVSWGK